MDRLLGLLLFLPCSDFISKEIYCEKVLFEGRALKKANAECIKDFDLILFQATKLMMIFGHL